MRLTPRVFALGLALSTTCEILAATPPDAALAAAPSEADFFTELPVVLSVSRLRQPLREAPGAVTVIDAEMIRQSGARTLAELLRLVPGFLVAENAIGAPLAVYHGLTTDTAGSMQVLIDGRTQYSPLWFGGVNWSVIQVSLADIERIEVVRGSNSAAFGANAVLGVVNVVTYDAAQTHGTRVALAAGNRGTREAYARHGWGGGRGDYRLSVEESRTEGLDAFPDRRLTRHFSGRADVRLDHDDELEMMLGGVTVTQGDGYYPEPTTWLYDNPPRDRYLDSYYAQIGWKRQLAGGDELRLRYFRVRESGSMRFLAQYDSIDMAGPSFGSDGLVDFYGDFDYQPEITRDDVEFQHTVNWGDARLVWGGGGRNDRVLFKQIYAHDTPMSNQLWRAFGNLEWRLAPKWLLNLGGTWEDDSIAGNTLAPRLMVNWLATPEQTLRAGVSRAYRSPSLYQQRADERLIDQSGLLLLFTGSDMFQETLSLHTLDPEEMTAYELGYLGEWKPAGVVFDARVFREELRGRVVRYDDAGGTFHFANAQDVNFTGAEAQLRYAPTPRTRFIVNHAVIQISSQMTGNEVPATAWAGEANYAEHSAPSNLTSLHWVQKLAAFESSLAYYRVGSYKWTRNTDFPAYERVDWRLAYPFQIDRNKGELALTLRAIGGGHSEYRRGGGPDRYNKQIVYPVGYLSFRLDF